MSSKKESCMQLRRLPFRVQDPQVNLSRPVKKTNGEEKLTVSDTHGLVETSCRKMIHSCF